VNHIDWDMTPEKAVDMYLEWGGSWTRGNDFVRDREQQSVYFLIYDWESPLQVTLLRRNTEGMVELAKIKVPVGLFQKAVDEAGRRPGVGVHSLNTELKKWVSKAIEARSSKCLE
jgi:hypothetical protein